MLECSICLDSLQGEDVPLSALRCGHLLHADCLAQHLVVYPRCPICSAPSYANDPTIRRIYLSAPEQRTPSPESESAIELVQIKQALARVGVQLENERIEKEAVENEVVALAMEKAAVEEKLQRDTHTKHRYKRERDEFQTQLIDTKATIQEVNEAREKEKLAGERQAKMLRVQISNLNASLKAKAKAKPQPKPLHQPHLVAAPNTRSSRRLSANSPLEVMASPPPSKRTRLSEKRRSQSVSVALGKKKRKALSHESSDEEDGSVTEEEEEEQLEEELDEDLLLEDQEEEIDVDAEVEGIELEDPVVSLKVSWSGRGNPSAEINVKGSDTIRTLGKLFLERSGMKPTSFRGPTGIVFERLRNKNKTVAELRGRSYSLAISALGCVRPA